MNERLVDMISIKQNSSFEGLVPIDVITVNPALVPGIVGRIDADALLLGRFGGNVCGHCLPLSARISTSPSAEADAVSQSIFGQPGKGKG